MLSRQIVIDFNGHAGRAGRTTGGDGSCCHSEGEFDIYPASRRHSNSERGTLVYLYLNRHVRGVRQTRLNMKRVHNTVDVVLALGRVHQLMLK
jgi:hypothetical protein